VQITGRVLRDGISEANAVMLITIVAPHQRTVRPLRQRENASVVAPQQLLLDIDPQQHPLGVLGLISRIVCIITYVGQQILGGFATLPGDMVEGLGTVVMDRLSGSRHFSAGAIFDQSGQNLPECRIGDIGVQRRPGIERVIECRRVGEENHVLDEHAERQIAETAIFVQSFGLYPIRHGFLSGGSILM